MKKFVLSAVGAVALLTTPALAADLVVKPPAPAVAAPSMWDIAFGGLIQSDYNFRGITQSNHGPSVGAYVEPRFNVHPNFQLYVGLGGLSVDFPAAYGLSNPAAEIDIYGGIRPTFGPVSLDLGVLYYWYPREIGFQTDFLEWYAKSSIAIGDMVTVGANLFYAHNWLNTGATGTYGALTAKVTAPTFSSGVGAYASGELGRYWLGTTRASLGSVNIPDYTYWNLGVGLTWKVFTLDFRYHDTSYSRAQCTFVTASPPARNWCGEAFIAKLAFDMTLDSLK